MRGHRVRVLAVWLGFVSIAACSGGDGGGGGGGDISEIPNGTGVLTTGAYDVSHYDVHQDPCAAFPPSSSGLQVGVTVVGTSFQIGSGEGTVDTAGFFAQATGIEDFNDDPFGFGAVDCVVQILATWVGDVTANDEANVDHSYDITIVSGTECEEAAEGLSDFANESIEFPCLAEATYHIRRVGEL